MIFVKNIFKKIVGNFKLKGKNIKFGIDPTHFSIHIGHLYIINFIFFLIKKKFFIIFIIGDLTSSFKKKINKNIIIINSICLKSQLFNIIGDVLIYFNSIFIIKKNFLYLLKIINILNIKKYVYKNTNLKNININKIIYPFIQSFDSIMINSFIEIGGIDQLINIFCARFIQKIFKKEKQNSILFYILEKNNKKISKSNNIYFINNYFINIILFKKIFYNLNIYTKKYKVNNFVKNYYNKKFNFKYFKNFFFKNKNFSSFYFKKILLKNKNFFYNLIYNKKIIINKKVLIKNFILTKKKYTFNFFKINFYDK
ncbi:MAG: hypothetical protein ACH6QR_00790 [Candidatus Carsonella ruddii]